MANGAKELQFWGETERERRCSRGALYAAFMGRTLRERVDDEHAAAKRGARPVRRPTDLPAPLVRYLEVEAAFVRLAAKGAAEYLGIDPLRDGAYDSLSDEHRALYDKMVDEGAREIRALCVWVFVERRNVHHYRRDRRYVHMALMGVTRQGFGEFLRKRIEAVKCEIEERSFEESA